MLRRLVIVRNATIIARAAQQRQRAISGGGGRAYRNFSSSDNVTYSGGQEGTQGGFYGSGGARSKAVPADHHRPEAVASLEDVNKLRSIMEEVSSLESKLMGGDKVTSASIEVKASIKKLLTSPAMSELLKRMEMKNEPVWGLTQEERELVKSAREKVNTC